MASGSSSAPAPSAPPLIRTMSEDDQHWENFFQEIHAPENYEALIDQVKNFMNNEPEKPIVLISSGGTTVPLETLTVRFVGKVYFLQNT